MNEGRIYTIRAGDYTGGPVVYWMSRDQRLYDNHALIHSWETAFENKSPLSVVFNLAPSFLRASTRHFGFMLRSLKSTAEMLNSLNIPFTLLKGEAKDAIPEYLKSVKAGMLITDFDPLKIKKEWKAQVKNRIDIPFLEVDAHNIVPCRIASPKQEFAAYTIRPKIKKLLDEYLTEFQVINKYPFNKPYNTLLFNVDEILRNYSPSPGEIDFFSPGESEAHKVLKSFIDNKLQFYGAQSNDPLKNTVSSLSPYLHYGQISSQRIALEIQKCDAPSDSKDAFLEQLIIRKELSDNFCHYNENYDNFDGFRQWARDTLNKHRNDTRDYIYDLSQFENVLTHDPLWNAAQTQMVKTGKMHSYMRMYWAKKILEWAPSPEKAMEYAIYLNDKYSLDGRDPNGYTGIAWSIGGVHDRAWAQRPVFGKIRYMNYNGARRKFDVDAYIRIVAEYRSL